MKRVYKEDLSDVFGMSNLVPKQTGLSVDIWTQHRGLNADNNNVSHKNTPRVKLTKDNDTVIITIEPNPEIKFPKGCKNVNDLQNYCKQENVRAFKDGIKYVAKNYDLFLKHYMDTEKDEYTDYQLEKELHDRGYFKFC